MENRNEEDIDREYLNKLENRLKALRSDSEKKHGAPSISSAAFVDQLRASKNQQIFELLAGQFGELIGEDLLTEIQANWLQRRIAPGSVAVNKEELLHLVREDHLQKDHEKEEDQQNSELDSKEEEEKSKAEEEKH